MSSTDLSPAQPECAVQTGGQIHHAPLAGVPSQALGGCHLAFITGVEDHETLGEGQPVEGIDALPGADQDRAVGRAHIPWGGDRGIDFASAGLCGYGQLRESDPLPIARECLLAQLPQVEGGEPALEFLDQVGLADALHRPPYPEVPALAREHPGTQPLRIGQARHACQLPVRALGQEHGGDVHAGGREGGGIEHHLRDRLDPGEEAVDLADEVHQGLVLGHPAEGDPHARGVGGEGEDLLELGSAERAGDQHREGDVLRAQRTRSWNTALVPSLPGKLSGQSARSGSRHGFGCNRRTELPEVPAGGNHRKTLPESFVLLPAKDLAGRPGAVLGVGAEPGRPVRRLDPRLDRPRLIAQRPQGFVAAGVRNRTRGAKTGGEHADQRQPPSPTTAHRPVR